jgi:ADP-ribose pyrophosphatase YjhB (NUDIX family)
MATATKKYYSLHNKYHLAVDCVIFGFDKQGLKLLLIQRNFEPEKGKWSLMGGFLGNQENLDNAAKRILKALTGLSHVYLEQLYTFSDPQRDPGEHVVSTAYYAFIRIKDFDAELTERHGARWFEINKIPPLIFDHQKMVKKALDTIRQKNRFLPIGIELLPEKFTIPDLQHLYEEIYEKKYDNANFRKKVMSMGILKKLNEKNRENSKKGAYLYEFDRTRFSILKNDFMWFQM